MNQYKIFLAAFFVSTAAAAVFLYVHITAMLRLANEMPSQSNTAEVFSLIFSPLWLASFTVLLVASLLYRIIGIVIIANNPNVGSSDRVLWIIGFLFMGFITAIIFMVLKDKKKSVVHNVC